MFRYSLNNSMNKLTSNICVGCIGGLYAGLVFMSIFLLFFANENYQALEILVIYGYAMIIGSLIGGLISYVFYKN